ncbi:uncharacterized protein CG4951 isoform X2 [Drosophila obscura]|uniref:uncharacterized protein CG4951 isoform X2 n=1 Tax=Drosophila obscura TaxID=7282 RepID=UPI001BB2738D|nr:uncharacterized protein CG4951 isoform X2 [Drosophila obscura]
MAFNPVGDCQLVLQTYKYKKHRIICEIKVRPCLVNHFGKKSNEYHWMTPDRWANIESGLWGLLEQEQDVHNVHADLSIDHMKVRVESNEFNAETSQMLLPGDKLSKNDISLNIQIEYIPQEGANNVSKGDHRETSATSKSSDDHEVQTQVAHNDKPTKRTLEPAQETHKDNGRSSRENKPSKRTHRSQSIDQPAEASQIPPGRKVPVKMRNARRSISHDSVKGKSSNSGRSSRENKTTKRTHTPESEQSRPNSDGPSPTGRPHRSLTRPSHLDDFVIGQKKKTNKIDSADAPIGKKANANGNGKASPPPKPKYMQLADALAALTPAPRKVDILLMNKMEKEEVLSTFSKYESDLNQFFMEHRHKRTDQFMGIQHFHVIDILRRDVEESMLRKLSQVYSTRTAYASMQINALLPLWIVRLFMDTFNFSTAEEAVRQIRDQLAYGTYLNAVNDEPLESDLEN